MEPLSTTAIAVSSILLTKAVEKSGEKLGETFVNQVKKLIKLLRGNPVFEIISREQENEKITYNQAIYTLDSAIQLDVEISKLVESLSEIVVAEPMLFEKVRATAHAIHNEPSVINNYSKLADKIGVVVQSGANATFGDITFNQ